MMMARKNERQANVSTVDACWHTGKTITAENNFDLATKRMTKERVPHLVEYVLDRRQISFRVSRGSLFRNGFLCASAHRMQSAEVYAVIEPASQPMCLCVFAQQNVKNSLFAFDKS